MDPTEAGRFADEWIAAWNRRDVDAVLSHFAPDAAFSSPLIPQVVGEASGVLVGTDAIRDYWNRALVHRPALHFTLTGLTVGHDALAIRYDDERGRESVEVLLFDGDRVVRGAGTYGQPPAG